MKNIVFIGFMAVGKTKISQKLARQIERKWISTDKMVVEAEGRSIEQIFDVSGEEYFRQKEAEVIRSISCLEDHVIDCGGGIVLNPDNIVQLKEKGLIVCLQASLETIYQRVRGKRHRPLLQVEDPKQKIKQLFDERRTLYNQADKDIDTEGKTIDQVCIEIIEWVRHE